VIFADEHGFDFDKLTWILGAVCAENNQLFTVLKRDAEDAIFTGTFHFITLHLLFSVHSSLFKPPDPR
jgi:hypothetical protein